MGKNKVRHENRNNKKCPICNGKGLLESFPVKCENGYIQGLQYSCNKCSIVWTTDAQREQLHISAIIKEQGEI